MNKESLGDWNTLEGTLANMEANIPLPANPVLDAKAKIIADQIRSRKEYDELNLPSQAELKRRKKAHIDAGIHFIMGPE